MKQILLICVSLLFSLNAFATYPEAQNEYVNDYANVLNASFETELKEKLHDVEYYSGVEITVATILSFKSYETRDQSWEAFSTSLFNYWRVGNIQNNDGVLLLISKQDRKIRIELGRGYASHYDQIMKTIIDESIAPYLKQDNFEQGIKVGIEKIIDVTTTKVSFFHWYRWYILGGFCALISLIIALKIDRQKNPALFWILLGSAGFIIIEIFRGLLTGNSSSGFGGGSSGGGGASGDF